MSEQSQLGNFQLLEKIGQGGMGTIFKAFDPTLHRDVAIKLLKESLASDPRFVEDFLREARNAAAISHPHIVQVYLVGELNGQYYVVMELLQGRSLRQLIESDDSLDEEQALQMTIEVADALRAAYVNKQLIHGDIKPGNIFLTTANGAKVLDFGLAKLANVEVPAAGEIWGSPFYVSPERVGCKAEDFRSDVYSLGASLFHTLTGRPPFNADTIDELAVKRLNERAPGVRQLNPELTQQTEDVVAKMLSKNPLTRYRDHDHLIEHLREAKSAATARRLGITMRASDTSYIPSPVGAPASSRESQPKRFRWAVAAIAMIAALAIALGVTLWMVRNPATSEVQPVLHPVPPAPKTPTSTSPTSPPKPTISPEEKQRQEQARLEAERRQQELVAAETKQLQTVETELTPLWSTYDFQTMLTRYRALDAHLQTTAAKQAAFQRIEALKPFADFKAQLIADIAQHPYNGSDLVTRSNDALPGELNKATDTEVTFTTQYGELQSAWGNFDPKTLVLLAHFYMAINAGSETPDTQARRNRLIQTFAQKYNVSPNPPRSVAPTPRSVVPAPKPPPATRLSPPLH